MITTLNSLSELEQLWNEIFLNKTSKVSDISDNSVLSGVAYGVAKIAQKAQKDIAIIESHILPDSATGSDLDESATLFGIPSRKTATGSSTFVRIIADSGTQYLAVNNIFTSYNGIQFQLEEDVTVGDLGYAYAKVRSIETGVRTNVDPNTVISVTPEPTGHIGVTNEYKAEYGADEENDELFRQRIKKHLNILSRNTVEYITQVFRNINQDILRVFNLGLNETGQRVISIATVNGQALTQTELDDLLSETQSFFSLSDLSRFGKSVGIKLENVGYTLVDIDFRVQILDNYDTDSVRKQIQVNITKYLDFRNWKDGQKVEWDDLLQIVKDTEGVRYVPDNVFSPSIDIQVTPNTLPRIRGFIMRDLSGNIISDSQGVLAPVFYPVNG